MTNRVETKRRTIDLVAEEFWNRYSKGNPKWRPPVVNNNEGRLRAYKYFKEREDAERTYLTETANQRFAG